MMTMFGPTYDLDNGSTRYYTKSITTLDALANWNTSKVMYMDYMFAECRNLSDTSAIKNWDRTSLKMLFKIANPVHTGIDKYQLKILRPITAGFFDLRMCDKYTKQNLF